MLRTFSKFDFHRSGFSPMRKTCLNDFQNAYSGSRVLKMLHSPEQNFTRSCLGSFETRPSWLLRWRLQRRLSDATFGHDAYHRLVSILAHRVAVAEKRDSLRLSWSSNSCASVDLRSQWPGTGRGTLPWCRLLLLAGICSKASGWSSFGFSRTNAHVVISEAPLQVSGASSVTFALFTLLAKSEAVAHDE